MPRPSIHGLSAAVLALLSLAAPARAQECVGIPSHGHGFLTYGFEGTDGATGDGLTFAYSGAEAGVVVQRRSLKDFTLIDDLGSVEAQGSVRVSGIRLPVCVVAGANWTAYDAARQIGQTSGDDPNHVIQQNTAGGPYRRLRVPVGLSVGREFRRGGVTLTPFASPTLVYESESYQPARANGQSQRGWGWGASGGMTAAAGWLVVRSTVSHTSTPGQALSLQHEGPSFSLQAGVRF